MIRRLADQATPRRWRAVLVIILIAVLAGGFVSSCLARPTHRSGSDLSPARFSTIQLGSLASLKSAADVDRYQVLVLQSTDAAFIPLLKAINPRLRILVYQDPFLARPSDPLGLTVCSTSRGLATSHGAWLLHDDRGSSIQDARLHGNYLMNVGDRQYERFCVAHAIILARLIGADGVLFDDVNASLAPFVPSSEAVPNYRSAASWEDAETGFLRYAAGRLRAAGLVSYANIGGANDLPGLWDRWSAVVDGSVQQGWNDWLGTGARGVDTDFRDLLQESAWSEAHGKFTILESDDDGEAENTFGLASMMLVADGHTSYCTANLNQITDAQWYSTYPAARRLGPPTGLYRELDSGLFERRFRHGLVLVDPTDRTLEVKLTASMVDGATGKPTGRRLSVPANTAFILTTAPA